MASKSVRLTQTVKKGGCAAKLPAGELRKALAGFQLKRLPELHVGTETLDDACLWDLGGATYLVQTLDFFTPIVDDAFDFGAIAAANSLSDVYAMGGEPKTALTILAFPSLELPMELLGELMRGAITKIEEAGACLAGGHTIDDDTLKLGFSVSGFVEKSKVWKNSGAKEGDALILTKGLGTGTLTTALKADEAPPTGIREAIESMSQLNRVRDLLGGAEIHAATDITGFGLAGHAFQMAQASGVVFEIACAKLPVLPQALHSIENEYLNRAHHSNATYVKDAVCYAENISSTLRWLTVDPQTSGGLLLSLPKSQAETLVKRLNQRFPRASIIGEVKIKNPPSASTRWVSFI
jgi:selenide,water dikinase